MQRDEYDVVTRAGAGYGTALFDAGQTRRRGDIVGPFMGPSIALRKATRALLSCVLSAGSCFFLAGIADAFTPVVGDEFVVGGGDKGVYNGNASLATADGSHFVVAWREFDATATDEIRFARLDGAEPVPGSEVLVAQQPALVTNPTVAVAPSGKFLVVWGGNLGAETEGILARLYDASGSALGASFLVNTFTTGSQDLPYVTARSDGSFVVVWRSESDGAGKSVARAVVGAGGGVSGPELVVNTYTTGDQEYAQVGVSPGDGFMVVWHDDNGRDGSSYAVFAQRFNAAGSVAGTEFQVNAYTTGSQMYPAIATDSSGNFVVAWSSFDGVSNPRFRKVSAAGAFVGSEITMTSVPGSTLGHDLATSATGEIAFVWDDSVQRFDSSGAAIGAPFRLTNGQPVFVPQVAYESDGDMVHAWNLPWQAGGSADRSLTLAAETCVDDSADADGDGIGKRCDVCAGGSELLSDSPRLTLKSVNTNEIFHDDRVQLSGTFVLPVTSTFADIDPRVDPVHVRVESAAGIPVLDAVLAAADFGGAGTAGWTVDNPGKKWKYRDKTAAPIENIISMLIQDDSRKGPGRVRIKLTGRYGLYFVDDADVPLRVSLLVADAAAGDCVETDFIASECRFQALATTVSCKR
jgi:hypothetical protein